MGGGICWRGGGCKRGGGAAAAATVTLAEAKRERVTIWDPPPM